MPATLTVIFCLPGKSFSNLFLDSWTNLLLACKDFNVAPIVKGAYNPNIYKVRNLCLMGDPKSGPHQKPFGGKIDYDYIMWIDSDSVFTPDQFKTLLSQMEKNENIHILSGVYLSSEGREYTAGRVTKTNQPNSRPEAKFLQPRDLRGKSELIEVDYTGMGFMLVRKGVFESLSYPWFQTIVVTDPAGIVNFITEDVGFCIRARKEGYSIYIDPKVIIGHEKNVVLK
jgi:hypothetical protein